MSRPAALLAVLVLSAAPVAAQAPDPIDLARGLRESGLADLALEYLDELAAKTPSPATRAVIPLEQARADLDLAAAESDDGRRAGLIAEAKAKFEQFLATNPNHPRRAEAAVSLARVVSVDARGILSRAVRNDNADARKAEKLRARPVFQDASKRFGQAAAEFEKKLDDPSLTPTQKKQLTGDVYQAELDRGINLFRLADTYSLDGATTREIQDRAGALDQAEKLFVALSKKDQTQPLVWVALAWSAECEQEKDSREAARKIFEDVRAAARKFPAARAGGRTAAFFELRRDYTGALGSNNAANVRKVITGLDAWLADPAARGGKPDNEVAAARFYRGRLKQELGVMQVTDKNGKVGPLNGTAKELLRSAEKDYKVLQESDNDYTERAAERRTQVMRALIGDADKNPAAITDFEECVMTAQVQLARALRDEKASPDDKAKAADKAAALYERARHLPVPKDLTRDAADAQANLVYTYLIAQKPQQAAVLGEFVARTARSSSVAARGGLYAVQAYLTSAGKVDPADTAGRRVDLDRAIQVGLFLDKQFPTDGSTDSTRVVLGQQLLRDGRHLDAFDMLSRVRPGSPRAQAARLIEGAAAYELLRSGSSTEAADGAALTPQKKAEIYSRAVADLSAVPTPTAGVPEADARLSVLVSLQLAEVHLTNRPAGYTPAEQAAALAADKARLFANLTPEEKQDLGFKAENTRVRAVFAQAYPMYQQGRYADTVTRLAPVLVDMARNGPAAKPDLKDPAATSAKRYDDFRRNEVLVLALQCRVKEGAIDQAGELFDLLKRFGGSVEASVGAMGRLIDTVGPQVAALRKAGKADEANKLAGAVGTILDRVANEPNVSPAVLVFLGRGLREIGNSDKAVDLLNRVPAPPAEVLAKPLAGLPDAERLAATRYRSARLELARAYRQAKKFADADKVLADALGTKEKKGWAATDLNFRKENAHLLEAKAADTADPKQANKLWGEAVKDQWGAILKEYQGVLIAPLPKEEKARNERERLRSQVKPIYFDLFFEYLRCVTAANVAIFKSNPGGLPAKLTGVARQMADLEKRNPDLTAEVKAKFADLLDEVPALKAEYEKQDGPKGLLRQNQNPPAGGA